MTIEQLGKMFQASPFQPFRIHMANGRCMDVRSPKFVARSEPGRTIAVWGPDNAFEIVDLLLVTALQPMSGNGGSAKRPRRQA